MTNERNETLAVPRNWIHGEAINFLETPDVEDESGINAHYSRDLVLQCIDAALAAPREQDEHGREAFARYLKECEECAIVPDVAGAFHWAWMQPKP